MRFRLEQSLREGWIGLVLTTIIYPIWIVGASVHRVHWSKLVDGTRWSDFLLGWGGLIWGVGVAVSLITWVGFAYCESEGRLGQLWSRACCGLILLGFALVLSLPSWKWAAELVGVPFIDTSGDIFMSLSIPVVALTFAVLLSALCSDYLVVVGSVIGTLIVSSYSWTELVG